MFNKNGSEKQNAWAESIVNGWIKNIDAEIESHKFRASDDKYFCMTEILESFKVKAVDHISKMSAKQIIDAYTTRNMVDAYVIKMARAEAEKRVNG
jgi:hypothetical protein